MHMRYCSTRHTPTSEHEAGAQGHHLTRLLHDNKFAEEGVHQTGACELDRRRARARVSCFVELRAAQLFAQLRCVRLAG